MLIHALRRQFFNLRQTANLKGNQTADGYRAAAVFFFVLQKLQRFGQVLLGNGRLKAQSEKLPAGKKIPLQHRLLSRCAVCRRKRTAFLFPAQAKAAVRYRPQKDIPLPVCSASYSKRQPRFLASASSHGLSWYGFSGLHSQAAPSAASIL